MKKLILSDGFADSEHRFKKNKYTNNITEKLYILYLCKQK